MFLSHYSLSLSLRFFLFSDLNYGEVSDCMCVVLWISARYRLMALFVIFHSFLELLEFDDNGSAAVL
jgi:hypothetical protein